MEIYLFLKQVVLAVLFEIGRAAPFQDDFGGDNVDLYDDVIAAPAAKPEDGDGPPNSSVPHPHPPEETNGSAPYHNNASSHHHGRRFQLYVGNLTWVRT